MAGRNLVLEALRAGVPATALHVGPRLDEDERIGQAVMLAADLGIAVVEAGRAELDRLTGGAIHQGIVLRIRRYSYADPADLVQAARDQGVPPLIVALDGVTDPRNLGAVARSVAAFGGHGILVPSRRSAGVTAGAWKASAGTLARVRVAQTANLTRALAAYQQDGLFVAGLDADGAEDVGQLSLADSPLVLVVGSGGQGAVPPGRRALRRRGADSDQRGRVTQRGHRCQHRPVRGLAAARRPEQLAARLPAPGAGGQEVVA